MRATSCFPVLFLPVSTKSSESILLVYSRWKDRALPVGKVPIFMQLLECAVLTFLSAFHLRWTSLVVLSEHLSIVQLCASQIRAACYRRVVSHLKSSGSCIFFPSFFGLWNGLRATSIKELSPSVQKGSRNLSGWGKGDGSNIAFRNRLSLFSSYPWILSVFRALLILLHLRR